ncbi:MAG: orotate phosphoribosyltransferase [Bacteroidales bacterium]|nr:orotate phosphoribosyltransferase [Bacteroidales bacterium]
MKTNRRIAESLLQSKAIILEPASPFNWASGWKSPIYCDNRKTLSFPEIRSSIRDAYVKCIHENFEIPDVIAGVATGAIAQGALVADAMNLPFIYIRSSAKGHGMQNLIEGHYTAGQKVIVIEDLISTGGSSMKAVSALKEAGCEVTGMVATFTYGFRVSEKTFAENDLKVRTLTDYETMLEQAVESGYIEKEQLPLLQEWRLDPAGWTI